MRRRSGAEDKGASHLLLPSALNTGLSVVSSSVVGSEDGEVRQDERSLREMRERRARLLATCYSPDDELVLTLDKHIDETEARLTKKRAKKRKSDEMQEEQGQ